MPILIRHQLTLIISLLIVFALTAAIAISYPLVSVDYEKKMQQNSSIMAESLASNIELFMLNAYNITEFIAENPDVQAFNIDKQQKLVTDIKEQYPFFQLLAIHNAKGDRTASSSGPLVNRSERWWFKKYMADRQPYISNSYYSLTSETPITTVVHGIYNHGELVGLVMADIGIGVLQDMVENYNSGKDSYAYLLDSAGVVVAHADKQQVSELYNYKTLKKTVLLRDSYGNLLQDAKNNEVTAEVDFEISPSLKDIVSKAIAGETGVGEYVDLNGEEYICAYRGVQIPGSAPWSLIVVQKKSAALAFLGDVAINVTVAGILVLAFSVFLTHWFARRITTPLLSIVNATEEIKNGNLAVSLDVKSPNEIGVLAVNFNQMVDELRRYREKMEELVNERTADLAAAAQELEAMNQELTAINEVLAETNKRLEDENNIRQQAELNLLLRERQYRATTALLTRPIDELEQLLETIVKNAVQLLKADSGYIGRYDKNGNFYIQHGIGVDKLRVMEPQPADIGMQGHVYRTGRIFYVEDYQNYQGRINDERLARSTTVIMLPLKQAGAVEGLLAVSWLDVIHRVSNEDLEVLSQFGNLASVAIERANIYKKIYQMAHVDALTGLQNHTSLRMYLEAEMEKVRSGAGAGIILFIDIDDLKPVNDNFGYSSGNDIIIQASQYILETVGEKSFVSRTSGDEFVVVFPGENTSRRTAADLANKVIKALNREYKVSEGSIYMSASVGVVFYPDNGNDADDLLMKANSAMYAAKKAGRNCWRFYEPVMFHESQEKMKLTNGLRRAIERGELSLYYQPQIHASDGSVIGYEALLRWNSAEFGFVSPARFIVLAEQSGLIISIGKWVIKEACNFARKLAEQGQEHLQVAINISPRQLMSDDFVEVVRSNIEEACISAQQIDLEITESVLIESMNDTVHKLSEIKKLGVSLSLDDFGTGYSSLTYLRNLPVDSLKIDKSFIDKIENDQIQLKMVGSIIDLGHSLNLKVVAEGVETEQQLDLLRQMSCDGIQGYIYSPPLPEAKAIDFLRIRPK